jgi:hypothetical protein
LSGGAGLEGGCEASESLSTGGSVEHSGPSQSTGAQDWGGPLTEAGKSDPIHSIQIDKVYNVQTGVWMTPSDFGYNQASLGSKELAQIMWDWSRSDSWNSGNMDTGLHREMALGIFRGSDNRLFAVMDAADFGTGGGQEFEEMGRMGAIMSFQGQGELLATAHTHPWLHGGNLGYSEGDVAFAATVNFPGSSVAIDPATKEVKLYRFVGDYYRDVNHYVVTKQNATSVARWYTFP